MGEVFRARDARLGRDVALKVLPDLFARDRLVIVEEPFLIVDGVLQNQDGVTSVRAEQVQGMRGVDVDFDAHDFY